MALNRFHDETIPRNPVPRARTVHQGLSNRRANHETFDTAFSRHSQVHRNPVTQSDAKKNSEKYLREVAMYGLATVAILYIIYGRK